MAHSMVSILFFWENFKHREPRIGEQVGMHLSLMPQIEDMPLFWDADSNGNGMVVSRKPKV